MSESKEVPETDVVDASPIETATTESSTTKASAKLKKKTSRWPWILILLIALGAIAMWKSPEPVRQHIKAWIHSLMSVSQPVQSPARSSLPAAMKPLQPSISSEEVNQLLKTIADLTKVIEQTQQAQKALKLAQQDIATMQLRTRLSWLVSPANHLPQLQLGWEEISLLPGLENEGRQLATSMRTLAQQQLDQVRQWQQQLDHLIATLNVPNHNHIVPSSDNPWLDWIGQQFSMKRSLSSEVKEVLHLRRALTHIRQNMNLERWPEDAAWQQLRSRLHLHLVENTTAEQSSDVLQLPESFMLINDDIEQLRQTAQSWLERL